MVIFLKIVENEIDVQLKKYKNLIQELLRDYEQNYISQSDYTDFKEKYMLQINQLNIEKEELLKIKINSYNLEWMKQFKKTGWWRVSVEDFRILLDIPKSYVTSDINKRVLAPIEKELPQYFKGLKIHKIKSKQRGNKVIAYEFTFQKQVTTQWIEGKYDSKKATRKEKLPEWAKEGYQYEEPEVDEKIQQELANRLKKYEKKKSEGN